MSAGIREILDLYLAEGLTFKEAKEKALAELRSKTEMGKQASAAYAAHQDREGVKPWLDTSRPIGGPG